MPAVQNFFLPKKEVTGNAAEDGGKGWVSGMDYIPQSKGRQFLRLKLQEKV